MILIIDNYDSFVYNLAQSIGELGEEPVVYRNDAVTIADIEKLRPTHIVISPGPCTPLEAGISNDVIRHFQGKIPILGVCLGHQCIGRVYGAKIVHAVLPVHGKSSLIFHDKKAVYRGLPYPFEAGRYHSLVVEWEQCPPCIEISAVTRDGVIMGIRHHNFTVEGVQFHPESVMTDVGQKLLANFMKQNSGLRSEEVK
jgi:anthranilate synthase/aminodeoxychorismate synthase-like glutamine amidotransferase